MKTKKNSTIHDISKKLNLSIATVSRALNNSSKVKPRTKAKILAAASELNYQQNHVALALKSGQSKIVGVVVPFLNHNFFSSVIGSIENTLSKENYHVAIYQTHESYETEVKHIKALLNAQVDGIFLSASKETKDYGHINEVLERNKPLIFFDRKLNVPGTSSVVIDDFKAAYEATTHLIKQGAKKIAHFAGDFQLEIYQNRFNGFIEALKDNHLDFDKRFFYRTDQNVEGGIKGMKSIWQYKDKPDAIFSSNDFAVGGAIQVIREYGLSIPKDLLIAGFSNEPFTQFMETPISTVDQAPLKMGETAAEIFLKKIRKEENLTKENSIILNPTFFPRASSLKNRS
ncbi:LacI family DNA-binding transcriptional regulator [Christiangramia crocea]|uniref:LacI family transcriptional regulator n=1 Tax=Christiangramia crocea TaxID=2904124 RepID=A0A9X1UZ29_9FLAO|nr:LacI family DNA-binding transcriptional regulator [Gramella crocea]MCG9972846.1 LacI family transcriptional regulator [Gramella crocea]